MLTPSYAERTLDARDALDSELRMRSLTSRAVLASMIVALVVGLGCGTAVIAALPVLFLASALRVEFAEAETHQIATAARTILDDDLGLTAA